MKIAIDLPHSDILVPLDSGLEEQFRSSWRCKQGHDNDFCHVPYSIRYRLISITIPNQIDEKLMGLYFDKYLSKRNIYFLSIDDPVAWSFSAKINFSTFCDIYYELSLVTENIILTEVRGPFLFSSFTDATILGGDLEFARAFFKS